MKQIHLQKFLELCKIPHFSIEVYGQQIKVVTLREEYAARWVELLGKVATVQPVQATTSREKRRKGAFFQPPAVPAFKILATIKTDPKAQEYYKALKAAKTPEERAQIQFFYNSTYGVKPHETPKE